MGNEAYNAANSNSTNSTDTSSGTSSVSDTETLVTALLLYGAIYFVVFILFCLVRQWFPVAYNVRQYIPQIRCDLAQHAHGTFDWTTKLFWTVTEEELFEQCGMDALCFVRALSVGYKLSCLGIMISFVLLPLYARAPTAPDTSDITDIVVRLTIANIPEGSNYLYIPAVASYVLFCSTMHWILQEFVWFTKARSKFLSRPRVQNYTVYVTGIPPQNCTDDTAFGNFFKEVFSPDSVLTASVSLYTPQLQSKCIAREKAVLNYEHAISKQCRSGIAPTHAVINASQQTLEIVDSISTYREQIEDLNKEISDAINAIERKMASVQELQRHALGTNENHSFTEDIEIQFRSYPPNESDRHESSTTTDNNDNALMKYFLDTVDKSFNALESSARSNTSLIAHESEQCITSETKMNTADHQHFDKKDEDYSAGLQYIPTAHPEEADLLHHSIRPLALAPVIPSNSCCMALQSQEVGNGIIVDDGTIKQPNKPVQSQIQNFEQFTTKMLLDGVAEIIGFGTEEGSPLGSGFVTFTKLSTANAAKQMIHSITPFQMDVTEAPAPDAVIWSNVGKKHHITQIGKLLSITLTVVLCLFWTIPVTFIVSLTEVDSLRQAFDFIDDWLVAAPWLEPLLLQISPQLVVLLNDVLLPMILWHVSNMEGLIGASHVEGSRFTKLVAFEIIQTFFVASLAGAGIATTLTNLIENPTELIQYLATVLPPQSTLYIQIVLVTTVFGVGFECLRITALFQALCRMWIGPRLSDKERNMVFCGLRPLSNPRNFLHAQVFAGTGLHFMVIFVYATLAPITCYVLAFCFLTMNVAYRHQLIYIYPPTPDSGGRLWMTFIHVVVCCMIVAQLTLGGYLYLKRSSAAFTMMIPLLLFTVFFYSYIYQRHFKVAQHLSSEICRHVDMNRLANNENFLETMKSNYVQPWLTLREVDLNCVPVVVPHQSIPNYDTESIHESQESSAYIAPGAALGNQEANRATIVEDNDNPNQEWTKQDDSSSPKNAAMNTTSLLAGHFNLVKSCTNGQKSESKIGTD